LSERIGNFPFKVRPSILPPPRSLRQPVGMEFLTSENRSYLVGREQEIEELLARLGDDPIVLLLGDSGVGKTSLIHAGLIPKVTDRGWRAIYTRPLGYPCADIIRQIQTTVFERSPTHIGPLLPLLAEVSAALREDRTLLIIDQFEDILVAREDREITELTSELRAIRELATPSMHVLICYRSDLEGRLGQYWQAISGSPLGLPRVYLSGIKEDEAWEGVTKTVRDLSVDLRLRDSEEKRIKNDLLASGRAIGFSSVYPPHIQMLVDHIWSSSKKAQGKYIFKYYQESGGMEGVIGGYLNRQLEYAQDSEGHARLALVSLVRSYGVKAQRTIDDIVADTGLDKFKCEVALERLIDLRLVRHVEDYYEVSHDFVAKRIISTLVDSEEREFKRFRELLTTKTAAYQTTGAALTCEELLMLYKHKERIIPNEQELHLLLISWFQGKGPALYWLLSAEPAKLLEWSRSEENKETISRNEKVSIVLLRKKLGETPMADDDYLALRSYQLSAELAALIREDPLSVPDKLVANGLRHRREEVREACLEAIAAKIRNGDWNWIGRLQNSSSLRFHEAYQTMVLLDDVPIPVLSGQKDRPIELFALLKKIVSAHTAPESMEMFESLMKMRPPLWVTLFGRALVYIREGKMRRLLREAEDMSKDTAKVLLSGIGGKLTSANFDTMVSRYEDWNSREGERYKKSAIFVKANALAEAIARSASSEHLPRLHNTINTIRLTSSSRGIVLALLKYGKQSDLKLILDRIATAKERIDYWNHVGLGSIASKQMAKSEKGIPRFLKDITDRDEFWQYISSKDRRRYNRQALLTIQSVENRSLYIRLAAYAMIGAAKREDEVLLLRLTNHVYSSIASAAAKATVRVFGESALRNLSKKVDESIRGGQAQSLADALRSAEMELFHMVSL
jgi:hypothetical protein